MQFLRYTHLSVIIIVLVMVAGCNSQDRETAAAHNLEFPDGVESVIPIPAEANIMTTLDLGENGHSVVFQPGISWPDALAFFTGNLASGGWTLISEDIPEGEEGERTASWEAEGHGVSLSVSVTTYGGSQGFNTNGMLLVR